MQLFRKLTSCCLLLVLSISALSSEPTYLYVYQQDENIMQASLKEHIVLRFSNENLQISQNQQETHSIAIDNIKKIAFGTADITNVLESVSTEENATVQKVFENGVIIIIKDGVRYNLLGVRL